MGIWICEFCLQVSEAATREKENSIFIPSDGNGWEQFRKTLAELDDTAKHMCPPFEVSAFLFHLYFCCTSWFLSQEKTLMGSTCDDIDKI